MRSTAAALLALPLAALACAPAPRAPSPPASPEIAVAAMLDDWHAAAARADEAVYFGHLAKEAVFLGTDATERWDKAAFRAYAHPRFAGGKAWSFRASRRAVTLGAGGVIAWFDEDLTTERLGPSRGSGVAVWRDGAWQIAQYNLTITVPNERFEAVKRAAAGEAPPPAPPAPPVK